MAWRAVWGGPRPREKRTDPSPLKVKEIRVGGRRYVVCLDEEQAKKDVADGAAIVEACANNSSTATSRGRRRGIPQVSSRRGTEVHDRRSEVKVGEQVKREVVLQTDLEELTAEDTALQYKQLWMVEEMCPAR